MAEIDVFKGRVADILARYADEVRTDVDAPAVARRVALEHPRRRAGALSWRAVAPSRAWVLLLVAALLTALVGGLLVAGSRPPQELPAVGPTVGQVFVCPAGSTPDKPGPADQARPPVDSWGMTAFDRRAGSFVALVDNEVTGVETWTFDVCTNTWTAMHPDQHPPSSEGSLVYDVDSDVTIRVTSREVWAYDRRANTWTRKGSVPPIDQSPWIDVTFLDYDPVTGLVVAAAAEMAWADDFGGGRPPELWNYDVTTDTWTRIRQGGQIAMLPEAYGPEAAADRGVGFAYDASADRIVGFAVTPSPDGSGFATWLFDLRTGTWSRAGADTPDIAFHAYGPNPPAMVYDEVAERVVVFAEGRMAAYDATEDRWEILMGDALGGGKLPDTPFSGWWMDAYDPVNKRLVGQGDADSTWAFDLATGQWTVLLEARRPAGTAPADSGSRPVVPARPGWAPELEAMLPSDVNGVTFTKTSVVGGIPSTRLGKGGWGTVGTRPLAEGLKPALDFYGMTLADLDVAIATPTDWLAADTFAIAFQVKGHDPTELARLLADLPGVGPAVTATVGGKQVQRVRDAGGMGIDVYVKGDVVFYVFTDGTPLIDGIIAALP